VAGRSTLILIAQKSCGFCSGRAGEVQVESKTQRRTWEKENREALIQFHGRVYFLCVVGTVPLHIGFLLLTSFICCVCNFMEELKTE
jgi:hypothetical protein